MRNLCLSFTSTSQDLIMKTIIRDDNAKNFSAAPMGLQNWKPNLPVEPDNGWTEIKYNSPPPVAPSWQPLPTIENTAENQVTEKKVNEISDETDKPKSPSQNLNNPEPEVSESLASLKFDSDLLKSALASVTQNEKPNEEQNENPMEGSPEIALPESDDDEPPAKVQKM